MKLTCSPKTDPATLRVRRLETSGRRTLDKEQVSRPGADRPQGTEGGAASDEQLDPETCKQLGISEATYHRWRNRYGGMKQDAIKRLRELEKENGRLKKVVADKALDIQVLKEVSRKNY
jgi:hypothetical protein